MSVVISNDFHTDSKLANDDNCLVDQICIDVQNKEYYILKDVEDYVTDGYDEEDNLYCSTYVNREIFDLLVYAVQSQGYALKEPELYADDKCDEDFDDE